MNSSGTFVLSISISHFLETCDDTFRMNDLQLCVIASLTQTELLVAKEGVPNRVLFNATGSHPEEV